MDALSQIVAWLSEHEAAISAVVGITVLAGVLFAGVRALLRRRTETSAERAPAGSAEAPSAAHPSPADLDPLTVSGFEGRPAIAVLPFDNLSGDPGQEYFADGIAEDLITDLSRISGLFVIARNSSFAYKGKPVDVRETCRELRVSHVLEGSVQRSGSRVRISAQLAEGATGRHLWAERYDRDLNDLFAVQDDVTRKIVVALQVKLTDRESGILAGRGTTNLEAYDHFLQAREYYWIHAKESNAAAEELLQQAIDLDPCFSAPYSMFAHLLVVDYVNDWGDRPERLLSRAEELATKAVELDASDAYAHMELGAVYLWTRRHELAIREGEKSITLDSNFARGYAFLATALHFTGRFEEAITRIRTAMRLDPHYPDRDLHFLAQNYYALGRFQEAIDTLRQRLVRNPDTDVSRVLLASAYGHLGLIEEARGEWEEALRINPNYSLEQRRSVLPYKDGKYFDRIADGLRKAGLPE